MVARVHFFDETASGERSGAVTVQVPARRATVRELIRQRVEHEVAAHNARDDRSVFHGLVQPTGAEAVLNGYRLRAPRMLDAEAQVRIAWEAFERNGFFLLVDDRQVESLDEEIDLGDDTDVAFLKLVPLVGG